MAKAARPLGVRAKRRVEHWLRRVVASSVDRALAQGRVAQTEDVWNRFAIRAADGHLIPLVTAINEVYARLNRVESKLDLLLGQRPPVGTGREPVRSTATLALPTPPDGWAARSDAPPAELELEYAWGMFVGRTLADKGIARYEPTTLPHFLAALELAPIGAVFDVGANIGPYGLLARAFSDRTVVGFEPTPDLASAARRCAALNGLDYRVEELALGDHDGEVRLYLSDSTDSSNSLNPQFRPYSNVLDVPLERLDGYVQRTGIRPGLLKVDTETTEPAVLRGAERTVGELRPWIFCEVLAGQSEQELADVVEPWGYTAYHLTGPGRLSPSERILGDPTFTALMYLLVPEPLPETYWRRVVAWDGALHRTRHPIAAGAAAR